MDVVGGAACQRSALFSRLSVLCFTTSAGRTSSIVGDHPAVHRFYIYNPAPTSLCSYHGVAETDLVNLTSCFGYELWRFSTTCTLILESVKATGIVLLLGVGSFVCYRLYHRYRHRRRWPSTSSTSSRNIDDQDDDSVELDSSSSSSSSTSSDGGRWWLPIRQCHRRRHRSTPRIVRRWISTQELIDCRVDDQDLHDIKREYFGPDDCAINYKSNFDGLSSLASGRYQSRRFRVVNRTHVMGHCSSQHSSPAASSTSAVCYNIHSGSVHVPAVQLEDDQMSSRRKRPNSLPLRCQGRHAADVAVHRMQQLRKGSDGDSNSADSLNATSTDEERGVDGDDEDGDECFLRADGLHPADDDEDDKKASQSSGSMVANYSPGSLLNRRIRMSPASNVRFSEPSSEEIRRRRTTYSAVDDFLTPFDDVHSIQRDMSFGSEFSSEMSVDTSVFNDIGIATQAKIESIQLEIDSVKRDIESYMQDNSGMNGPTPTAFTELVKPSVSDASQCSSDDVTSGSQDVDSMKRQEKTRPHLASAKRRAEFRRTRLSTTTPEQRSSCDTSLERHSSPPSSVSKVTAAGLSHNGNTSANLSLEWDSMKCNSSGGSIDGASLSIDLRKRVVQSRNSNTVHGGDSGSDFGTPLTNGSPEPCRRKRSGSVASLEWDDQDFELNPTVRVISTDHQSGPTRRLSCNNFTAIEEVPALKDKDSPTGSTAALLDVLPSEKKMWSSMESGYVDEFSSSQVSPQDYSLSTTVTTSTKQEEDPSWSLEAGEMEEEMRTWPVVGPRVTTAKEFRQMPSKEFFTVCKHLGFGHARPIHCDNYCALRAVLVQALTHGFSVLENSGGVDQLKKKLGTSIRSRSRSWIRKWNFARHMPYVTRDNCLDKMLDCLQALDWLVSCVLSSQDRERVVVDALNSDTVLDVQVMEGMKLLLLAGALDLHETMTTGQAVPNFVSFLFARETSPTPEAFLVNHLNSIGHTCGPGHIEMQMLGHVLGVTICVLNPSKEGQSEEFIAYYPDYHLGSRPEIYLASVDEHRYSIIVK